MARTYGRDQNGVWQEITETNYLWLATLTQTLRLNKGESPFYANYGIGAQPSVMKQIAPDADIAITQSQFSQYFQKLIVVKNQFASNPTYNIYATFLNGVQISAEVAT